MRLLLYRTRAFLLLVILAALTACSSGIDLEKSSSQLNFGVQAARMNLWREALFRFQRATQLEPDSALAHNNLAVAYEGIGEFDKARAEYNLALKLDKGNQFIQKNYSRFVEFYSKNAKRELKVERDPAGAEPAAAVPPPAPPPPPVNPDTKVNP